MKRIGVNIMTFFLTVLLTTGTLDIVQAQGSAKPTVDSPILLHYQVPASLDEFVERADAVVVARITGARDRSAVRRARTEYDVELLRVLKEHNSLSGASKVCRPIGVAEHPDRLVRRFQPGFPGFAVGTRYLLFLAWNEQDGCFSEAFGPPGVAVIDEATGLQPLVRDPVLNQLRGFDEGRLSAHFASLPKRR